MDIDPAILRQVLLEQIGPAALLSGLLLFATWPWRRRFWPAALAVGAGCATGDALARGLPEWAPADTTRLLFHFAVLGALLGVSEWPRKVRWVVRFLASFGAVWLLSRPLREQAWNGGEAATWLGGLGLGLGLFWSLLAVRASRMGGISLPLTTLLAAAGGGLALERARSALLGQVSGVLAATLGSVALLALLRPGSRPLRGAVPATALVMGGLWMCGHLYAELPAASALLLTAAPLLAVRRWWISGLLAAAAVAGAVYLSHLANPPITYDY